MSKIIHEGKLYDSRSDLVRKLLKDKKYRKTAIARCARVTPQTVESIYKDMVIRNEISDYYPKYKEALKKRRLAAKKKKVKIDEIMISDFI